MAWLINGNPIKSPNKKRRILDIQTQNHRTLDGGHSIDYIGSEKFVLECEWDSISLADYNRLSDARDKQINLGLGVRLFINETGLSFNGLTIMELPDINFHVPNHYQYRNIKVIFRQLDAIS